MIHITPAERPWVPTTSPAIIPVRCLHGAPKSHARDQLNTSLIREMRTIAFVNKLIEQGRMGGGKLMLVHVIEVNLSEHFRG